jgi:hypothetical protein
MKKLMLIVVTIVASFMFCSGVMASPVTSTVTAGDEDYAATRSAYDNTTNMDWYVFKLGSGQSGAATNSLGIISWTYNLPYQITTAYSGSMTVRVWDIDPGDIMKVFFDFGGANQVYAGLLTGSNGGNITTWENAVASGTTASLGGWSTTTFNLDAAALAALSGTTGFNLLLKVENAATDWAAVIDYASFTLNYEPGKPNPTPEPASMLLVGLGLIGLAGVRRKLKK